MLDGEQKPANSAAHFKKMFVSQYLGFRHSISMQLGVWVVTIVILIVLSLGEVVGRFVQEQIKKEQSFWLNTLASTMASRLQQHMLSVSKQVVLLANLPQMTDSSVPLSEKQLLMQRVRDAYPQFTYLGITDANGVIQTDIFGLLAGKNVAQREWFIKGQNGLSFVDVHDAFLLAQHLPKPKYGDGLLRLVDISVPIISNKDQFLGVLGAHLSLDWAYEEKNRLLDKLESTAVQLLIYNSRGELLLSSEVWSDEKLPAFTQFKFNQNLSPQVMRWPDGQDYLSATAVVSASNNTESLNWRVVAYKPAAVAFAPAIALHNRILWLGLLFSLILAALLGLFIRFKLAPLRLIDQAAEQLRQGELNTQIPSFSGESEIARLSRSLSKLVNELQQQNTELRLNERVFQNVRQAIVILDAAGKVVRVNSSFEQITGYPAEEVAGESFRMLYSSRHSKNFYDQNWADVFRNGIWSNEVWYRRKDGFEYPAMLSLTGLHSETGDVSHFVALFEDISEQLLQKERLLQLANFDRLTGISNRYGLEQKLAALVQQAEDDNSVFALLLVDLDNFKNINDSVGHAAGDQVLKLVCQRFDGCLDEKVTLARWGGDEFVVLLPRATVAEAINLGERLLAMLKLPFVVDRVHHFVSATIGIATYPESSKFVGDLLRCADAAMYLAKKLGKNRIEVYRKEIDQALSDFLVIENRLRFSLNQTENGLALAYQPQFSMDGEQIIGAEALLRWHDTELGNVGPDRFIPVAEQTQLISLIGKFVIEQALADYQRLQSSVNFPFTLSLNISPVQLTDDDFLPTLEASVSKYRLARQSICLEITETALMTEKCKVTELLKQIKQLGYLVSIDDFGIGYSSLQYLSTFKPHEIKVDRSFVQAIDTDEFSRNIVVFTMSLAKELNLIPIAEGVESTAQMNTLRSIGYFNIQGYLYSKPLFYDDFYDVLQQFNTTIPQQTNS
ncbi:bifunctional diguanylate cyclase/phosphodiesterase [Shewanella avicenniae]|nr:EAL domain-containing protein [Shewanella avicenniae]